MDHNFWIDVHLQDQESENKLLKAISTAQYAHNWTVDLLNQHFVKSGNITPYADFRKEFNKLIREKRLWRHTQRYSLEKAVEKTFPYYSANIRTDVNAKLKLVEPEKITEIAVRSRKVWKKYLAQNRGITTLYGTIFLDGDWKKILREQAGSIPLDLFPYLWHSITLRYGEGWKLRFNHHLVNSTYGRKAEKNLEKEYAEK